MKIAVYILRIILVLCLLPCIAVSGWLVVSEKLMHKELPEIMGYSIFVTEGDRMTPTLEDGSMVITRQKQEYVLGDVIAMRQERNAAAFTRIVGTHPQGCLIRRDSEPYGEEVLLTDQQAILGEAVVSLPYLGRAAMALCSIPGLAGMVALLVLICLLPGKGHKTDDYRQRHIRK